MVGASRLTGASVILRVSHANAVKAFVTGRAFVYVGLRKEETIEEAMNGIELMRRQRGKAGTSGGVKGGCELGCRQEACSGGRVGVASMFAMVSLPLSTLLPLYLALCISRCASAERRTWARM